MWSGPILALIGLSAISVPVLAAPLQPQISDALCSGGAPRLIYVTDVALMSAQLTTAGSSNSTRRRVCAVDLVTCLDCHLKLTVLPSQLTGCEHRDQCRCHHLEMLEQGRQYDPGLSDCSVAGGLSMTSVGRTLDIRLSFLETLSGEVLFRVESRENRFIFSDPSEVVETAQFPVAYPAHYVAEYVIKRPEVHSHSAILLSFTDYFVSPWSLLELTDDREQKVATYSGDVFRPPITLTNSSWVTLRFHANGRPGAGFRAKFDFIPPSETGALPSPPRTDCGGVVVSAGGAITMLNMTSSGTVWFDCVWLVRSRLPAGHAGKLSLRLLAFRDFAPGSQLRIVDGQTTRGATVALVSESDMDQRHEADTEHVVNSDRAFYVHLRAGFRPASQLAIVYSSFRNGACGLHQEMSCGDGRCIALFLRCDGFAHCPDRSDEESSCYTHSLSNSLGVQDEDTWTLSPPNFYFPGPSHAVASLESATLSLLAMCLIIVLTMTSAIIFIYSNGRVAERRARNRILQSISNLIRDSSVEVVSAAPDEPPDYEPPPDYEQIVHCFTVQKRRKRKRKHLRKAIEPQQASRNRRLPRHNTVPSLHHFSDWLRHHTHSRASSTSPTSAAPAAAAAAAATATATATAVAMAGTPEETAPSAETPLTVQLPPEKEEFAVHAALLGACRCAGACGCGVLARRPSQAHRPRGSIPRSKSADVLSSALDEEPSVTRTGRGERSPPPPYQWHPPPSPTPTPAPTPVPTAFPEPQASLNSRQLPPLKLIIPQYQPSSAGVSHNPPQSPPIPQHLPPNSPIPHPPSLSPPISQSSPQLPPTHQPLSKSPSITQSPPQSPPISHSTSQSSSRPQSPPQSPAISHSTSQSSPSLHSLAQSPPIQHSPPQSPPISKSPPLQLNSSQCISRSPVSPPSSHVAVSISEPSILPTALSVSTSLPQSQSLSLDLPQSSPPSSPTPAIPKCLPIPPPCDSSPPRSPPLASTPP
ncbi:uncharacterized protein LOC122380979 [Amphibalanus amphitrite]|uniref:uncharacterized protein LOC122380979 n=1 Tax=Amphibalanus amphitrite TaxID=1232801 RepID=UPI001C9043BF|nr:uncharacterized protein LOC122380979 [Amphibalanus amphitrite]